MESQPFETPFPIEGSPEKAFSQLKEMGNALGPIIEKQANCLHESVDSLQFGLNQVYNKIDRRLRSSLNSMEKKLDGLANKQLQCLLGMVGELEAGLDIVKANLPIPDPILNESVTINKAAEPPCTDCGPAALAADKLPDKIGVANPKCGPCNNATWPALQPPFFYGPPANCRLPMVPAGTVIMGGNGAPKCYTVDPFPVGSVFGGGCGVPCTMGVSHPGCFGPFPGASICIRYTCDPIPGCDDGTGNDTIGNDTIDCIEKDMPVCPPGSIALCCNGEWQCLPLGETCPGNDTVKCGGETKPKTQPDKGKEWKCCNDKWVQVGEGKDCPGEECGPKKVCCDADKAIDLSQCLGKPDKGVHRWISLLPWGENKGDEAWVDSECGDREIEEYFSEFEPVSQLKEFIPDPDTRDQYAMDLFNDADDSDPDEDNKWHIDCGTQNADPKPPQCNLMESK